MDLRVGNKYRLDRKVDSSTSIGDIYVGGQPGSSSPLKPSHIKTRDSLRQSARSRRAAERSRAILQQIAAEIDKQESEIRALQAKQQQLLSPSTSDNAADDQPQGQSQAGLDPQPTPEFKNADEQLEYDARRFFRRNNSLPVSYIPRASIGHRQQDQHGHGSGADPAAAGQASSGPVRRAPNEACSSKAFASGQPQNNPNYQHHQQQSTLSYSNQVRHHHQTSFQHSPVSQSRPGPPPYESQHQIVAQAASRSTQAQSNYRAGPSRPGRSIPLVALPTRFMVPADEPGQQSATLNTPKSLFGKSAPGKATPLYGAPIRRQLPANLDLDGPREIIDATGSVPTTTFTTPQKKQPAPPPPTTSVTRQRSTSDQALTALLRSNPATAGVGHPYLQQHIRRQQSGANNPDSSDTMATGSSTNIRPWSQLITDQEVQNLAAYGDIFSTPTASPLHVGTAGGVVSSSVTKPHNSDTDVSATGSNVVSTNPGSSLSDLSHHRPLIAPAHPVTVIAGATADVDTMMARFKKSFSLRGLRRNFSSSRGSLKIKTKPVRAKSVEGRSGRTRSLTTPSSPNSRASPSSTEDIQQKEQSETNIQLITEEVIQIRTKEISVCERRRSRRGLRRSLSQPERLSKSNLSPHHRPSEQDLPAFGVESSSSALVSSESELSDTNSDSPFPHGKQQHRSNSDEPSGSEPIWVEAVFDQICGDQLEDDELLQFRAGDLIEVTDATDQKWWWGQCRGRSGWFPVTHVRQKVNQDPLHSDFTESMSTTLVPDGQDINVLVRSVSAGGTPSKRMSVSRISMDQVRSNCVLEIIQTERDFVKNLNDIVEGYLVPVRRHSEMFSPDRIQRIFANVEDLYRHQQRFLTKLESRINWDNLSRSEIGECFLDSDSDQTLRIYSDYCNNQPLAAAEVTDLYGTPKYAHFFEACRLLRNMIDIDLNGFLLTPVQKICKYPLQLAELLKYTHREHPDYRPVQAAQQAMQRLAEMVNERKRRIEALEQLFLLEKKIDKWEGPPLTEQSSTLFHSGDLIRVTGAWSSHLHVLLLDNQLVLCKKETLGKRYIFKGRIELYRAIVEDIEDGTKDKDFGVTCKHHFKIRLAPNQQDPTILPEKEGKTEKAEKEGKCYLFVCKSTAEKSTWLRAFAEERRQTREDQSANGFRVTDKERRAAQAYLSNRSRPRRSTSGASASGPSGIGDHGVRKRRDQSRPRRPDAVVADLALDPDGPSSFAKNSRAGSLPSYLAVSSKVRGAGIGSDPNGEDGEGSDGLKRQQPVKKKGSGWFHLGSSKEKKSRPVVTRIS